MPRLSTSSCVLSSRKVVQVVAHMASGFSLAFTGKKQARRVDVQEKDGDDKREAVIGFGKGGLETAEPRLPGQEALIIPKQENTYRVAGGKFRPTYLPEAADRIDAEGIDKFEVAGPEVAQEKVTYGLQQRSRPQANGHAAAAARPDEQQHPGEAERETEALKRDLAELPAEAPLEAYDAMPVDKFGEALLRGMGWQEGRAIGRGGKGEVVAKELVRRPQRLGLGATPAPDTHQKKFIKPGESRDKKDLVYLDADGHVKSSKPVDEKLVERRKEGVHPGKVMRVVDGRHSGLLCEVVALEPKEEGRSERARVRLLPSHETVTVRCMELGERQEERPGSRGDAQDSDRDRAEPSSSKHHHRHGAKRDGDDRSTRADQADKRQRSGSTGAAGLPPRAAVEEQQRPSGEEVEEEGTPWLAANIRVKVVDKRVRGGKLYLKKGVVVDVSQPTVCDVHFPDIRETVQHLRQSQLETVVPSQEGTPVLVLRGRLRGRRGRLLKRNTETGLAAVQLTSDLSLHKLSLDDISEFAGGHEED